MHVHAVLPAGEPPRGAARGHPGAHAPPGPATSAGAPFRHAPAPPPPPPPPHPPQNPYCSSRCRCCSTAGRQRAKQGGGGGRGAMSRGRPWVLHRCSHAQPLAHRIRDYQLGGVLERAHNGRMHQAPAQQRLQLSAAGLPAGRGSAGAGAASWRRIHPGIDDLRVGWEWGAGLGGLVNSAGLTLGVWGRLGSSAPVAGATGAARRHPASPTLTATGAPRKVPR